MEQTNGSTPGVAAIKSEYLIHDHVRELDLNFVATNDKKRIKNKDEADGSEGPPRKKLKGQNKHRPRSQKTPKSDKLCFKIGFEGSCPFGNSCCYSHDVSSYLAKKPPDIGSSCYLYRTFGNCQYSFSCRFGADHIKDGKNLILEEKWADYKDKKLQINALSKGLQISLRRRDYNFEKSSEALNSFSVTVKSNKCNRHISDSSVTEVSKTDVAAKEQTNIDIKIEEQSIIDNQPKQVEVDALNASDDKLKNPGNPPINVEISTLGSDLNSKCEGIQDEVPTSDHPISSLTVSNQNEIYDHLLFEPRVKKIDFKDKLYLAPLTTVGNLPFRRICKELGADITCSEMAMSLSLLQGQQSEWALLKRHHTEDFYGIQLCGSHPDVMTRCCQVLSENASFDFIDLNLGCPLEGIYKKGAGCGLMNRMKKLEGIIYGVSSVISAPLTIKMRTGIYGNENIAHHAIEKIKQWKKSVALITLHGRSREQRYTKSADWSYINMCNKIADPIPLFGNGDVLSYEDYNTRKAETGVSGIMIARGALIKPWIFKEIKEQNHWDISSSERFDILKKYSNYGLEHWGSDTEGVEKTRRFMLEWLSFLYRYIPVGVLEHLPQRINERPPPYNGRNDLETLMASPSCSDWVKISEMLLGPVPENFIFLPKHKANAYK